jgi:sucrose-6-phosphate hydrolase SacC (GH32 family)
MNKLISTFMLAATCTVMVQAQEAKKIVLSPEQQAAVGTVHKAELLPADKLVYDAEAISQAKEGMEKSIALANADPNRPIYHLMPEAQWMNDPNGAFYADGWYHVFYQLNPYRSGWGNIHWGHARSRDNVIWERLPVANWPSTEKGEDHCYSGSAVKDGYGNWQLWYPSVSKVREKDKDKGTLDLVFNGQVMLKPMDKDFIKWGKSTDDPVNKPTLPNNIDGYAWNKYIRDPAFFTASGRTFLVLGITGVGAPIYEAMNKELTEWKYRGVMSESGWDCPQMIPFGNKWLYVINRGQYFLGTFDPDTAKFTKESGGGLDQGKGFSHISFSTDDQGRHIVYSWIVGTKGRGWNNCFPLPRVLTLGEDGQPVQKPVPELCKLHGAQESAKVSAGAQVLKTMGDAVEINATFRQADKGKCGLRVRRSNDGSRSLAITYEGGTLDVFGTKVPIAPEGADKTISLQVFLDKAIMEIFINGGKKTVLRVMYPPLEDQGIEIFSDAEATVDVWPMKTIWAESNH